ncbi:MAG: SDR family oxidoreductase [Pseudomonadota bacterium]
MSLALVTGASRGFGYAASVALARAGYHVAALARTVGGLEEMANAAEAAGGATTLIPLDLTDDAGLQRMCLALHERWGGLDLWVHAAIQSAPLAPADSIAAKDFSRALAINVTAAQRLILMLSPLLRAKENGRVVYLTDTVAGEKFYGAYGATKAAQIALFESWGRESARIGPHVIPFAPRPMATSLRARFYPGEDRTVLSDPSEEAARMLAALD